MTDASTPLTLDHVVAWLEGLDATALSACVAFACALDVPDRTRRQFESVALGKDRNDDLLAAFDRVDLTPRLGHGLEPERGPDLEATRADHVALRTLLNNVVLGNVLGEDHYNAEDDDTLRLVMHSHPVFCTLTPRQLQAAARLLPGAATAAVPDLIAAIVASDLD